MFNIKKNLHVIMFISITLVTVFSIGFAVNRASDVRSDSGTNDGIKPTGSPTDIMEEQDITEVKTTEITYPEASSYDYVKEYAEAVRLRDGKVQYSLFSDELQANTLEEFESFNWVPGVSSPWISDYKIIEINELEYDIIFQYITSTGFFGDETVKVILKSINNEYKINEIITNDTTIIN